MLAGSDVKLLPGAVVEHNAKIAGGVVFVQGRIGRNLKLAAGEAQIASEIGGSVNARAESLKLLPGAVVRGDLVVYGPKEPEISPQAQVMGRVEYHKQVWEKTGIVVMVKALDMDKSGDNDRRICRHSGVAVMGGSR